MKSAARLLLLPVTLAAMLWAVSCGGGPGFPRPEESKVSAPVAVVVEREITGEILGVPLSGPRGLAVSDVGAVYCVDGGNNRIIYFRNDLTPIRDAGGAGSAAGLLDRPSYVAIDNRLNVFVSDEGNRRICRFNTELLFVDQVDFYDADDPLLFGDPGGVAVNRHGEMWISDRQRNQLAVYTSFGAFDRFIGRFGYQGGQVSSPEKILVDDQGQFVVCDAGNGRVVIYDQYGNHVRSLVGESFYYPVAAVPAPTGYWWVLDGDTGQLTFCDRDGQTIYVGGPTLPGEATPLRQPSDLVLLPDDRLLISDTGNNRLLVCKIIRDTE